MEQGVGEVEDVPFGDGVVGVVLAKLGEGPVCDVLAAVGAVFLYYSASVIEWVQRRIDLGVRSAHGRRAKYAYSAP
jgi:hypothetical protein